MRYWLVGYTVAVCVYECDIDWDQIGRFDNERSSADWNPSSSTPSALNIDPLSLSLWLSVSRSHSSSLYLFCPPDPPYVFSHRLSPSVLNSTSCIILSLVELILPVYAHVCIEGWMALSLLWLLLEVFSLVILNTVQRHKEREREGYQVP